MQCVHHVILLKGLARHAHCKLRQFLSIAFLLHGFTSSINSHACVVGSCTTSPYLVKLRPHNNFTDLTSLLDFKSHVADPLDILAANWTTNTSLCSWTVVMGKIY